MRVVPIPCLQDNYAYLVICEETAQAAVVDPSEAAPVKAALAALPGVHLRAIWNTHHHHDHVGGNASLVREHPGIDVIAHGSDGSRVPAFTRGVDDGDEVTVGRISARVIHNPGHTRGAVSYFIAEPPTVFTGDTLFLAGCGRLFEGTPATMHASLEKLAALPGETAVYCGHEYTASNLRFAQAVEPDSEVIARRVAKIAARGAPTVPASLATERATNPFLRVREPAVVTTAVARGARGDDPADVFAKLRAWKDSF